MVWERVERGKKGQKYKKNLPLLSLFFSVIKRENMKPRIRKKKKRGKRGGEQVNEKKRPPQAPR